VMLRIFLTNASPFLTLFWTPFALSTSSDTD